MVSQNEGFCFAPPKTSVTLAHAGRSLQGSNFSFLFPQPPAVTHNTEGSPHGALWGLFGLIVGVILGVGVFVLKGRYRPSVFHRLKSLDDHSKRGQEATGHERREGEDGGVRETETLV